MLNRENELVDNYLKPLIKRSERYFIKYKSFESIININNFSYKNIKCIHKGKKSNYKAKNPDISFLRILKKHILFFSDINLQ